MTGYPNFEGRACPIRPMSVEDQISRISPLCAHARQADQLEHTLMGSIRLQTRAYFMREDFKLASAAAAIKFAGRPKHATSCSNQNAGHPLGAYTGVQECGCYIPTEATS